MVLQYLKELVGEKRHPIIIDGQLLKSKNGNILYAQGLGKNFSIFTLDRQYKEVTLNLSDVTSYLDKIVEDSMTKYYNLVNNPSKTESIHSALTCKSTGILVLKTPYYALLSSDKIQNANNLPKHVEKALHHFLLDELINYYLIFIRIFKPRISRINKTFVKAHLVQDLFVPFRVSTKEILCPFNYPYFNTLFSKLILCEEKLSTTADRLVNFDLTAVAACDFADLLGDKVRPLKPSLFIFTLLCVAANSLNSDSLDIFLDKYNYVTTSIENDQAALEWFKIVITNPLWKGELHV